MVGKLSGIYQKRIRPRAKKILIGVMGFFALFTLLGFFAIPPLLKSILVKELSQNLHRDVTVKEVKFNPYTLSVATRGLLIKDRGKPETFFSCDEIFLNLETFSALRLALVLKEVRFSRPYLKITRNQDLSYNFSDLLEDKKPAPVKKEKPSPLKFSINNISIIDGSIDFDDRPKQTKHTVRELKIGVPFLSDIPSDVQKFVQPHFSAKINDALYVLQGKTKPFADSLETSFDVDIKDVDIPDYLAYLPIKMNFKIVSAFLDTQAKITFVETKKKEPSLTVVGTVSLKNVALADERNNRFFALPLLGVTIAPSEPLAKRLHLSKVLIESPRFEVQRDEKGVLNVQTLLPEEGKESAALPAAKKPEDKSPFSLDIDEIELTAGKVAFSDLSRSKPFKTLIEPIDAKVDRFSNGKDKKGAYSLTFKTEAGEAFKAEGTISLVPLGSDGALEVLAVPLKKYSPYYSESLLFDIEEGRLDFSTRYSYAKGEKEPQVNLSALTVMLKALRLRKTGENDDFAKIPGFAVKETELDLTRKEIKVGSLSTEKGEIYVKRMRNGDLNLLTLLPQEPGPVGQPKKVEGAAKPVEPVKPWVFSLKQMLLDKYTVQVEDQTTRTPTSLIVQKLRLKGEGLSTAKGSKGKVAASLLLNGKGTLTAAGTMSIEPLSADLRMEMKGIEIVPFQPYFARKVRATVTGGALSMAGRVSLASTEKKEMKGAYKGEASLTDFAAIDRLNGTDLLKLDSLSLTDMDVGFSPLSINIRGVSLTDFYALVLVNPEGKINLQEILVTEAPKGEAKPDPASREIGGLPTASTPPTATEEKAPKNIKIDQITLQAGKIDFVDKSVKPEFSTKLSEMAGKVSGLSAQANTTADVQILAKLNDYAPLEITGKINPLREDLFVDLKARIKDLDLSAATPYSGKYTGYTIQKGKLSFDAQYSIVERKLNSQNNIFIDQFTFGEKVDSPQATNLPVRLAVALLKDRKGEIKLDLPVSGSLDDPKFSVWKVVLQVIVNLITKAATSPFALLGAVFGGGEELSYVEFDYGSTVLTEPNMKKLDTVIKALHDRPSLSLEIEGHADKERDTDGLRQLLFQRKVKAQKLNEMVRKGQPALPVDEVKVEPAEYEKYLKAAYRQEKFPKPKNVLGLTKDIPVPEMEKLILTHTEVKEGDLRTLASQRAMKVKDAILKSQQVDPQRVFIVEPKALAPEKKAKLRDSRVDFKLK